MSDQLDTRLLRLTDELISKGVAPTEAANIAARTVLEGDRLNPNPWLTPEQAAQVLGLNMETIYRALQRGAHEFKGAKKFSGMWRIPAAVVRPCL